MHILWHCFKALQQVFRNFKLPDPKHVGEGWLGFLDLWSGQKPWWNWYLNPVVNFGEVRRAQLAKSSLLTLKLVSLGSYQIFKVCSDAEERVGCRKQWEAITPIHRYISKTAAWILEFVLEDLPLSRTTNLVPEFVVKDLPLGRIIHEDDDDDS